MNGPPRKVPGVLIDASNLSTGGGVQVAASLVDEMLRLRCDETALAKYPSLALMEFRISPEVDANLSYRGSRRHCQVSRTRWYSPSAWLGSWRFPFAIQVSIFGPRYGRRRAPVTITGLADGTSVYQWPEGVPAGSFTARFKRAIRGAVSRHLFRRESHLISESRALLSAFEHRMGYAPANGCVIPNVVNRSVMEAAEHRPLGVDLRSGLPAGTLLLTYPARLYPHKNHRFLPPLVEQLQRRGITARVVVTLTPAEWATVGDEFRATCINVGIIRVSQIADLHSQCDATVFPSLMESFSATPIEAIAVGALLFAADRPFVREFCADAAVYFDPLDPADGARVIAETLADSMKVERLRKAGICLSAALPTAHDRAQAYLDLIEDRLAQVKNGADG